MLYRCCKPVYLCEKCRIGVNREITCKYINNKTQPLLLLKRGQTHFHPLDSRTPRRRSAGAARQGALKLPETKAALYGRCRWVRHRSVRADYPGPALARQQPAQPGRGGAEAGQAEPRDSAPSVRAAAAHEPEPAGSLHVCCAAAQVGDAGRHLRGRGGLVVAREAIGAGQAGGQVGAAGVHRERDRAAHPEEDLRRRRPARRERAHGEHRRLARADAFHAGGDTQREPEHARGGAHHLFCALRVHRGEAQSVRSARPSRHSLAVA